MAKRKWPVLKATDLLTCVTRRRRIFSGAVKQLLSTNDPWRGDLTLIHVNPREAPDDIFLLSSSSLNILSRLDAHNWAQLGLCYVYP